MNKLPTQEEAIKKFLIQNTYKELADLYNENMEVQVIVNQADGTRIYSEYTDRRNNKYTDNLQVWYPFRIPVQKKKVTSEEINNPEINNLQKATSEEINNPQNDLFEQRIKFMTYDLSKYVEGIGLTGWDYVNKVSRWVAFDFDAIVGHKGSKRLTNLELDEIINRLQNVEWVEIKKSTSGKGLHLYVFLSSRYVDDLSPDKITINNRIEHLSLARAILSLLSLKCNYDLQAKVDTQGGNMWIWHRKMIGTDGLTIIKKGEVFNNVPTNWKDYIPTINGLRHRSYPSYIHTPSNNPSSNDDDRINVFEELCGQRIKVKLNLEHERLIQYLEQHNYYYIWNSERWILITHTFALKKAHIDLNLKGIFNTLSTGSLAPNDINCWLIPLKCGGWIVRRYSQGIIESDSWDHDRSGYVKCYYNTEPNLLVIAKSNKGMENKDGSFIFDRAEDVQKALKTFGMDLSLVNKNVYNERKARIKILTNGKISIEIERDPQRDNPNDMLGWIAEKKWWVKTISNAVIPTTYLSDDFNYDDIIRHLISEPDDGSKDLGWMIKGNSNDSWVQEPLVHVKSVLEGHYRYEPKMVKSILGSNVIKPWTLVTRPFQPEYVGNREWNRDAPQFRIIPNRKKIDVDDPYCDSEALIHPTWSKILSHVGKNLDNYVCETAWGKINNIITGLDYLKCWVASAIQFPFDPLPYLFLYGPENSGKSIFHESLNILLTKGCVRVDQALANSNFNSELDGAIFGIIEETNLKHNKLAASKIKDWVTSVRLSINKKYAYPYSVPNTCHFIQCNNSQDACPIFPGDTRVTMIYVDSIPAEEEIPKKKLLSMLEKEAADFLASILDLELPETTGRLNIPVITTPEKIQVEQYNKNVLELFLDDYCEYVPGNIILFSDFYNKLLEILDPTEITYWTKIRVGKSLPLQFPKGRMHGNSNWHIGNLQIKNSEPLIKNSNEIHEINDNSKINTFRWILVGDYLEQDVRKSENLNLTIMKESDHASESQKGGQ